MFKNMKILTNDLAYLGCCNVTLKAVNEQNAHFLTVYFLLILLTVYRLQKVASYETSYFIFRDFDFGIMDFYYMLFSPPCRSVLLTAKSLGIELNKKVLDLFAGEHLTPEFLKINPQHVIPTLVDNDFVLWESRPIMIYLVEQYGKDDALYPKCPKKQAIVNQRLYFDMGTLYKSFADYYYPRLFFNSEEPFDPELFKKMEAAFDLLNTFLEGNSYVAGDQLTVADLAILTTVSTIDVSGFDISKYPNVARWYENAKKVPGWEESWEGALEFKKYFKNK